MFHSRETVFKFPVIDPTSTNRGSNTHTAVRHISLNYRVLPWIHHTPNVLENNQNPNKFTWQKPHKPNLTGTKEAYYPNKDKDEPEKKYKSWLN